MISNSFNIKSICENDEDGFFSWQKNFFHCLFLCLLFTGIIPYILSCTYAVETSDWHRVSVYTVIYIMICGATFLKKIPFHIRVWAGISGFYAMGVFSMLSTGPISCALLYFLCFSAFAAIFSGMKGGVLALLLNILTMIGFGFACVKGLVLPEYSQGLPASSEWIVLIGTFSFLSAAITLSLAGLINALEISAREFKYLVKNTADIFWTLDSNLTLTFVNAVVYPAFGVKQTELIGKPISRIFRDAQIAEFKARIHNQDEFIYETHIHHRDGTPIPVEIKGSRADTASDTPAVYQGVIKDISRRKHQEEKQRKVEEKLMQAEKFKAVGILAGSVAHDLNNILSGIATYPEVLMMDENLDPKIRQGLTMIKDSGQKAAAVVSDLLTISRGSSAEMEIINMNSILDRYMRAHDFQKIRKTYSHVEIELLTEPELLNIRGSYIHIEKTIMNLVLNAVEEVSKKEDGKVFITTSNNYIDATLPGYEGIVPGEYAILSVIDNGSGIDQTNLNKIFEPFFTKKKLGKSGTGLGLTVVWNAVQDHKGFINVTSTGKGTKFDLLFPAVRQEIQQKPSPGSLDEIKGQGQVILVVDDLKDQQKIATTILENLGYCTHSVDNGYAAVEFIKKTSADLIILDMIMAPSISGLETYQMIKKLNPGQKAIIASGYSESDDVLMAQGLGAGSFVKKPYTILDMGIAVKEELEK